MGKPTGNCDVYIGSLGSIKKKKGCAFCSWSRIERRDRWERRELRQGPGEFKRVQEAGER